MRHARAEQTGATDFERRLAERGHADAAEAGRWLAAGLGGVGVTALGEVTLEVGRTGLLGLGVAHHDDGPHGIHCLRT